LALYKLEDPFFIKNRNPSIIEELIETYKNILVLLCNIIFCEIQNIKNWESAIRKLEMDQIIKYLLQVLPLKC
jgi:predicted AAA+ superfamily ATPase